MKVLDANFLIDYLNGVDAAAQYLLANETEQFVFPAPAYAEVLVGEGSAPDGDIAGVQADLACGDVYETDKQTATLAGEITDEMGPQGPFLTGMDALIAAVGRELGTPVVSADSDLTHPETRRIVDIEEYREYSGQRRVTDQSARVGFVSAGFVGGDWKSTSRWGHHRVST